jgi:hypothetical protein
MRHLSFVFGLPVLLSAAQPMLRDVSLKTPDGVPWWSSRTNSRPTGPAGNP